MAHTASMMEGDCLAVSLRNCARLSQSEGGAIDNIAVDQDVHSIRADSQRARSQVVYILTAINPEVRAIIGGACVNCFIDWSYVSAGGSGHGDGGLRQSAGRHTVQR